MDHSDKHQAPCPGAVQIGEIVYDENGWSWSAWRIMDEQEAVKIRRFSPEQSTDEGVK